MADSDAVERLDEHALARPGRQLARPGKEEIRTVLPLAARMRGPGIGD